MSRYKNWCLYLYYKIIFTIKLIDTSITSHVHFVYKHACVCFENSWKSILFANFKYEYIMTVQYNIISLQSVIILDLEVSFLWPTSPYFLKIFEKFNFSWQSQILIYYC